MDNRFKTTGVEVFVAAAAKPYCIEIGSSVVFGENRAAFVTRPPVVRTQLTDPGNGPLADSVNCVEMNARAESALNMDRRRRLRSWSAPPRYASPAPSTSTPPLAV